MIPARALRCNSTPKPAVQAVARAWTSASGRPATACYSHRSITGGSSSSNSRSSRSVQLWRHIAGGISPRSAAAAAAMTSSPYIATAAAVGGAATIAGGTAAAAAAVASSPSLSSLWDDIVMVTDKAVPSGACSKTDTLVELLRDPSLEVEFVLRVASALKAKPRGPPFAGEGRGERQQPPPPAARPGTQATAPPPPSPAWRNPFSPPEAELFVRHLGTDHSLVLNKFNVVQHHVLVITREFRSQAEPLYGSDLAAAFQVIKAMPSGGVAFYNCGPNSGRSQPHKHLQVVPLPFAEGQPPLAPVHHLVVEEEERQKLMTPLQPLQLRRLPYKCYAATLIENPSPAQLETAFAHLLQLAFPGYIHEPHPLLRDGPPRDAATAAVVAAGSVSYNVLLTRSWLMLVPRSAERCGPLALNSLAFAGTMLVRSEDELEYVRRTGPVEILARIGEAW